MTPTKTLTQVRFVLRFTGSKDPELWKTEFHHPHYAPGGRRTARGKDEGAHPAEGSFQWSPAVKVLAAYLLRCAAWGRRERDGGAGTGCPFLEGRQHTPAATLNYALSKKNEWLCDMFGADADGRPYLLDLIRRSNADLKRKGEPVRLCLDTHLLPPEFIEVLAGEQRLEDPEEIERLADAIEKSWQPRARRVVLTLQGDLKDWTPEKRQLFEELLQSLGLQNWRIDKVEAGSIKLTLQLPIEEAERLFWAVHTGKLDEMGVVGFEYAPGADFAETVRAALECYRQGQAEAGRRCADRATELVRRLQPLPDLPELAIGLNNLAALWLADGQVGLAEETSLSALAIGRRVWGPGHPNWARCLHNLALVQERQGQDAAAEKSYRRALAVLKPEETEAAALLSNLGSLYATQGRLKEAEDAFWQALELRERAVGPDHPCLVVTLRKLTAVLVRQERPAAAGILQRRIQDVQDRARDSRRLSPGPAGGRSSERAPTSLPT
jgi:tetratricopeptide (TPR) repeat protein